MSLHVSQDHIDIRREVFRLEHKRAGTVIRFFFNYVEIFFVQYNLVLICALATRTE